MKKRKGITTASRKAKGRHLQNLLAEEVRKTIQISSEHDVKPAIMGERGADLKLSQRARRRFGFFVECKNHERLSIFAELEKLSKAVVSANEKLKAKKRRPYRCGLLVFKRNRTEPFVALPLKNFLKIWERYLVCCREIVDKKAEESELRRKINYSTFNYGDKSD